MIPKDDILTLLASFSLMCCLGLLITAIIGALILRWVFGSENGPIAWKVVCLVIGIAMLVLVPDLTDLWVVVFWLFGEAGFKGADKLLGKKTDKY